jgi:hypothetical protein
MPVHQFAEPPLPVDEQVLLGCFGLDLAGVRQERQLRLALRRAGYPAALAGRLVHHSPLLVRQVRRHYYRLRRCDEHETTGVRDDKR